MPSPTNKAQDNSIRENVYRVIRENITSLQLAPGTTVSTQELAAKLQVSRTPVREAFIRLQKEDLVEITPQKGTMVSRIDLTRAEKERFIRESLETAILPLFLQNCTEPDLKELELLIEKQKACFTGLKPLEFIALDNQFHQRFFELAGQDLSWDVVASTNPHYNRLRVLTVQNAATFDGAVRQHEVMMDQIRRRDIDALRRELTDHVRKIIAEKNVLGPGCVSGPAKRVREKASYPQQLKFLSLPPPLRGTSLPEGGSRQKRQTPITGACHF